MRSANIAVIPESNGGKRLTPHLAKAGFTSVTQGERLLVATREPNPETVRWFDDRLLGFRLKGILVIGVYLPAKGNDQRPYFERLLEPPREPTILVGDFNCVDKDNFTCRREFAVLPYERLSANEYSYTHNSGSEWCIDHAFGFGVAASAVYDHSTRGQVSDHSAVIVTVQTAR